MSVTLGLRAFMPLLLQQPSRAVLTITASAAGLANWRDIPIAYNIAKHGALLLAENTQGYLLQNKIPNISCHVCCPFMTSTAINTNARGQMGNTKVPVEVCIQRLEEAISRGIFYIITPDKSSDVPSIAASLRMKLDAVLTGDQPYGHVLDKKQLRILRDFYAQKIEEGKYRGLVEAKL